MPRRALILLTALVLALHWVVLQGVPLSWTNAPPPPPGRVFSTRTVAAALPPAAATPTPPPPEAARAAPTPPRSRPQYRARPAPAPAQAPPAPMGERADTPAAPAQPATALASADRVSETVHPVPAPSDAPSAPTPEPTLPAPAQPAPAPTESGTAAGIEIAPPGPAAERETGAPPLPVRIPAPTRLLFDVSGQAKQLAYNARAELLWQHDGSRYEARQEISAFLVGSRTQRSVGTLTAQGLLPEKFSDKSRSEQAAHFDHARGRVTFSANTPEAPVGRGVQDRLSLFIQLGAMLAAQPAGFEPGTQITLTTVSARAADRWTFTVEGPETLDLPTGPTPALKLLRLPRKDYDQKAELWVAPDLNYLPVRIKLTQANGDFADLLLRSSAKP